MNAPLPLSPEMQALLAIVRERLRAGGDVADVGPADGREAGTGGGPATHEGAATADPEALSLLAHRHGLQGLLPSSAAGTDHAALPTVMGNLSRIKALHHLLNVLDVANVPALSLKGPALAVQAWGDVSARSYGDVDVLVPPERSDDTVRALEEAGYWDRRARFGRSPSPEHWHDWSFTAPDGRTLIEIHWALVSPLRYPAVRTREAWVADAHTEVMLPGGPVPALRPEIEIPYLAIHATAHHWGWLEFPLTLAGLIRRRGDDLDWDALLDRARRWRARRITGVGLRLADDLAGPGVLDLPDRVRDEMAADAGALGLARWYLERLLLDPDSEWYRGSPGLWWRALRLRDTPGERLRAGLQYLFGPTTAEWEPVDGDGAPGATGARPAVRRLRRLLRRYRSNS